MVLMLEDQALRRPLGNCPVNLFDLWFMPDVGGF